MGPSRTAPSTLLALALAGLAIAGCGSSGSHTSPASTHSAPAGTHSAPVVPGAPVAVAIRGYAFHPQDLTVAAGTRVRFTNDDATAHTATASGAAFDTGTLAPQASRTLTLTKPGTYSYVCQFHPFMTGRITVR